MHLKMLNIEKDLQEKEEEKSTVSDLQIITSNMELKPVLY